MSKDFFLFFGKLENLRRKVKLSQNKVKKVIKIRQKQYKKYTKSNAIFKRFIVKKIQ